MLGGCLGAGSDSTRSTMRPHESEDDLFRRASAALERPIDRLGPRADVLAYADIEAARRQLDLAENADFEAQPLRGRRRLLAGLAARPMFSFTPSFWLKPTFGAIGKVLDTGAIDTVVGTSFAFSGPLADEVDIDDVMLVETDQAFDEIARRLRSRYGFREADDGLLIGNPIRRDRLRFISAYAGFPFPVAAQAADRLVVFAGSRHAARSAVVAGTELSPAAELIADLPGVGRVAQQGVGCVAAVALHEDADPRAGSVVVTVDRPARAERLLFSRITHVGIAEGSRTSFRKAISRGNRVRSHFASTDWLNPTRLPVEDVQRPYGCKSKPKRVEGLGGSFR